MRDHPDEEPTEHTEYTEEKILTRLLSPALNLQRRHLIPFTLLRALRVFPGLCRWLNHGRVAAAIRSGNSAER